jgi:hypothetical protein
MHHPRVVDQFAVAALGACPVPCGERRNLLNQNPAVLDRRYKKPKCTTAAPRAQLTLFAMQCYKRKTADGQRSTPTRWV